METSNVAFSPNGRVLAVGLNANPKSSDCGVMRFYNVYGADTEPELQIGLAGPGASVVRVLWHTKLRQILATTTAGYTKVRCAAVVACSACAASASTAGAASDTAAACSVQKRVEQSYSSARSSSDGTT
eukprot:11536-Heterococcus_DN1.PRE.1